MRTRLLMLLGFASLVTIYQLWSVERKVPFVTEARYRDVATTLRVVEGVHYGFIVGHHGASLVRVAAESGAIAEEKQADPRVKEIMEKVLDRVPFLAAAEGVFYLGLGCVGFLVLPALHRRVCPAASTARRRSLSAGALAALMMFLFLAPRTIYGHGNSAFSTWVGPCALSSSGPYPRLSGIPGETVSYREVLEALTLPTVYLGTRLQGIRELVEGSFVAAVAGELFHVSGPGRAADSAVYWLVVLGIPFIAATAVAFAKAKWWAG